MPPAYTRQDAAATIEIALPASAASTVNSLPIDLQKSANGNFLADVELLVSAPAVNATMVPNSKTQTYSIITGNALDGSGKIDSASVLFPSIIVQTGANSTGAAAATFRTKLPSTVGRYVALRIVSGADTTDSSAVKAGLALRF